MNTITHAKQNGNLEFMHNIFVSFLLFSSIGDVSFSALQAKLSDMNIALDSANSNISRQQMNQETTVLRERNEDLQQKLEKAFNDRQANEAINEKLETEINIERNKINRVIESMSEADQQKYHQLDEKVRQLGDANSKMHEEINMLMNKKTNLETIVKNSTERAEAIRLLLKLNELEMKLMVSKEEEQNRLTPAQEREKLINEVRENKQALTSIQHQIKLAEDTLSEKRELLRQIDDDLDEGNSERYAKYKELKLRDETMTKFMDTFKESLVAERNSEFKPNNKMFNRFSFVFVQLIFFTKKSN